jgi:hypothetical protein
MNRWKQFFVIGTAIAAITALTTLSSSSSLPFVVSQDTPATAPEKPVDGKAKKNSPKATSGPVGRPEVEGLFEVNEPHKQLPIPTKEKTVAIKIKLPDADAKKKGTFKVLVGGTAVSEEIKRETEKNPEFFDVKLLDFQNRGRQSLDVVWTPADQSQPIHSTTNTKSVSFEIDTQAPVVESVKLIGVPGYASTLLIRFHENDLKAEGTTVTGDFVVKPLGGQKAPPKEPAQIAGDDSATVALGVLETGDYQIKINNVEDKVGNKSAEQRFTFSSYPEAEKGRHVEFPEFTPRPKPDHEVEFNPGDHVETRVARLYYFRDAHRVAQIINRNVKSYNRAAVDLARREAEDARERADTATDLRRQREREAIEKAQESRRAERELTELPAKLAEAASREFEVTQVKNKAVTAKAARDQAHTVLDQRWKDQKTTLDEKSKATAKSKTDRDAKHKLVNDLDQQIATAKADDPQLPNLRARRRTAADELASLEAAAGNAEDEEQSAREAWNTTGVELTRVKGELAEATQNEIQANRELELIQAKRNSLLQRQKDLTEQIPRLRQQENQTREVMDQAQAKEDRSREDQFRKEVAAAHEDPDTYVAAKIDSVDPVTQVSISVIGEGIIQLRGPIRGINRIRTMINQIDSPVGQVKVGIFTVQVNGEHGDRMEKVAQRIEGNVDISRFLTSQSMLLLRRAVQETAAQCAERADAAFPGGHLQSDRDRKYMYYFFGRDFTDELYAMDSELLRSGNKVLSVHAMDTVSLSKAMFLMSLAKNDVRHEILRRFMELVDCDLPYAEFDFRKASKLLPCRLNSIREVQKNVWETYRFRSIRGFFDAEVIHPDTMTPMQREFIRLAQIFKSQMVAEMELKQRVIERGLIQDNAFEDERIALALEPGHREAFEFLTEAYLSFVRAERNLDESRRAVERNMDEVLAWAKNGVGVPHTTDTGAIPEDPDVAKLRAAQSKIEQTAKSMQNTFAKIKSPPMDEPAKDGWLQAATPVIKKIENEANIIAEEVTRIVAETPVLRVRTKALIRNLQEKAVKKHEAFSAAIAAKDAVAASAQLKEYVEYVQQAVNTANQATNADVQSWKDAAQRLAQPIADLKREFKQADPAAKPGVRQAISELKSQAAAELPSSQKSLEMQSALADWEKKADELNSRRTRHKDAIDRANEMVGLTRQQLNHKKLLEHLIDEQTEKWIELVEGTRSHIATMDNYLKRLAIAIEDDCKVQFYDPAFTGIRKAAYEYDVQLGQVERTTILTNNRAFAKVSPQATMEFDLPKRDIMIVEGMKGAKALMEDYGALLQDPTFLSATQMLSGSPVAGKTGAVASPGGAAPGSVKDVLPGLPSESEERILNQSSGQDRQMGAALSALIPDPAIYKFETGTGFEIRPVIQPDGDSIIYDFNYMYTTNVREPVRADEKHLGRVKRHFIDTQVQTSSFELREISRYQVALKASRTGRGVPLLEDIPGLGVLFRPQASAESALQQNIILGQSTVYPTLFDLMGLRWAPHVVDVDHVTLRDAEHVIRGRRQTIDSFVFEEASDRVDGFLGIKEKVQYKHLRRRDLYHSQSLPSRYHPNGYENADPDLVDPTRQDFQRPDPRPKEMRFEPEYDRHGRPIESLDHDGHFHGLELEPQHSTPERIILPTPGGSAPTHPASPPETIRLNPAGHQSRSSTDRQKVGSEIRHASFERHANENAPQPTAKASPKLSPNRTRAPEPDAEPSRLRKLLRKLPGGRSSDE